MDGFKNGHWTLKKGIRFYLKDGRKIVIWADWHQYRKIIEAIEPLSNKVIEYAESRRRKILREPLDEDINIDIDKMKWIETYDYWTELFNPRRIFLHIRPFVLFIISNLFIFLFFLLNETIVPIAYSISFSIALSLILKSFHIYKNCLRIYYNNEYIAYTTLNGNSFLGKKLVKRSLPILCFSVLMFIIMFIDYLVPNLPGKPFFFIAYIGLIVLFIRVSSFELEQIEKSFNNIIKINELAHIDYYSNNNEENINPCEKGIRFHLKDGTETTIWADEKQFNKIYEVLAPLYLKNSENQGTQHI